MRKHSFRLYVAGQSANSVRALANLRALCETYFPDAYRIELVDVLKEPARALGSGVIVTPTLLKLEPPPVVRILGDLSETSAVLSALGSNGRF